TIEVQAPPGTTIGHVNQNWSVCFPTFTVCSGTGSALVKVKGPFCTESFPCCCEVKFRVTTMAGNEIGVIAKQWSGIVKEYFTDADNFGVSFPLDMDVYCKAALLACTMLIDYMFFESTPTGKRDAPGMLD
ncbi:phospholipid scramblase 1, putative, partial [Ixodes scapularis]